MRVTDMDIQLTNVNILNTQLVKEINLEAKIESKMHESMLAKLNLFYVF